MHNTYVEHFDQGESGWMAWAGMGKPVRPEIRDSAIISRSPWEVDVNHAPPGGGHLHLLFILHTFYPPGLAESVYGKVLDTCTPNRFIQGGFSTDLTDARVGVRIKGQVDLRGAQLVLLAQGNVAKTKTGEPDWDHPNYVNQVLTAQPLQITRDWSMQELRLVPDQSQWTPLGARHGSEGFYGDGPIGQMLRQVYDIIFVLFPLDVQPVKAITGDPHRLRAGEDYELDRTRLPEGSVMLDEVRIEYLMPRS